MKELDITVCVTCFNEEKLITSALKTVWKALTLFDYSYEVLVYDDASTDNSVSVVKDYIEKNRLHDHFRLIENKVNRGIGVNYFHAAEYGYGKYFLIVHGDNAVPLDSIKRMLALMGKADIIVPYYGTRLFSRKFNCDHRNFMRKLLSILFASLVRLLSGHELRYFNGLVLHKRENVVNHSSKTYGLGYQAELLCSLLRNPDVSYLEVKLDNYDLTTGPTSAFKVKNIISVCDSLWKIFLQRF